jgi:RNA polymerase sigma-70 factor (ECF subfamily)
MEKSDDELISEYRTGREDSLKILIERYSGPIYSFLRRMTGSPSDAEDIAQDTFVKVWRKLSAYHTNGTFKAWVFAIARNTAIDKLRKKRSAVFSDYEDATGKNALVESLHDPDTLPDTVLEKAEDKKLIDGALEELPAIDREILTLHYSEDMTFETIGKILKKPLNTVKSRHRRALAKLREFIEKSP